MKIIEITIENYLCYAGVTKIELSDGLNIFLGENGEGKTKFYEAIDWLVNGDSHNLDQLASAKMLSELSINETFNVSVTLKVEQYDEIKTISKSFIAKKISDTECSTSNYKLIGTEENKVGERSPVDGEVLLDMIFPHEIRRYSMFKGEEELNIFENDDALSILINSFSNSKHYEKYAVKGTFLKEKAEKAVDDATRSDEKSRREYTKLEYDIQELNTEKQNIRKVIDLLDDQVRKTDINIQEAEKFVDNADALETINSRIRNIESKISNAQSSLNENYTTSLFDESWLLVNFEKIHKEFAQKISKSSTIKRKLQSEYDTELGIKEGKKQLKAELLNNSVPLPVSVPSKEYMEEMLKDQFCKVCNRSAKKGTDPYKFMLKRLEEYLKSQDPITEDEDSNKTLFSNDYISRLFNLSVSHEDNLIGLRKVKSNIKDAFDFNKERLNDLEELNIKLELEQKEREKIIGASSIGADKLTDVLKNYNNWQEDIKNHNIDLGEQNHRFKEIEHKLKELNTKKDAIDTLTANNFLIKTRAILRDIETIFKDIQEEKFDEFINSLQNKSNEIFEKINIESFTGTIVFTKKILAGKTSVRIELQENGRTFHKPNQSLLTSMHISILFGISELANEYREESYPMIFDAPTSSFGEPKTGEFLNLIFETGNQKILLMKNFLDLDKKTKSLFVKKEFDTIKRDKAFWIKLDRPFDKYKLNTINSNITKI